MTRKYLSDAGIKIDSTIDPLSASPHDSRCAQWREEIDTYGFASCELWNLDKTMLYMLYERLRMWQEYGLSGEEDNLVIEGEHLVIEGVHLAIEGKDASLEQWVDDMVQMCQEIFDNDKDVFASEESAYLSQKVWRIWSEVSPLMWI